MTGDGETVTPLLPEPGVWTGMASANVWAPLRWKHAKIHRGSRQRTLGPHQEAGYTSAVVTVAPGPISVLQSGGGHIRPYMALRDISLPRIEGPLSECEFNRSVTSVLTAPVADDPMQTCAAEHFAVQTYSAGRHFLF